MGKTKDLKEKTSALGEGARNNRAGRLRTQPERAV